MADGAAQLVVHPVQLGGIEIGDQGKNLDLRVVVQKGDGSLIRNDIDVAAVIPQAAAAFWTYYYQDVFWSLLNSNEFILNH